MEETEPADLFPEEELIKLLRARSPDISWLDRIPELTFEQIKEQAARLTPEQRAAHDATIRQVEADIAWRERHQEREDAVRAVLIEHGIDPAAADSKSTENTAFDLLHEIMGLVREWTRPALVPTAETLLAETLATLVRVGCQFDMCPGSDEEEQAMLTCHVCATVRKVNGALDAQPVELDVQLDGVVAARSSVAQRPVACRCGDYQATDANDLAEHVAAMMSVDDGSDHG